MLQDAWKGLWMRGEADFGPPGESICPAEQDEEPGRERCGGRAQQGMLRAETQRKPGRPRRCVPGAGGPGAGVSEGQGELPPPRGLGGRSHALYAARSSGAAGGMPNPQPQGSPAPSTSAPDHLRPRAFYYAEHLSGVFARQGGRVTAKEQLPSTAPEHCPP